MCFNVKLNRMLAFSNYVLKRARMNEFALKTLKLWSDEGSHTTKRAGYDLVWHIMNPSQAKNIASTQLKPNDLKVGSREEGWSQNLNVALLRQRNFVELKFILACKVTVPEFFATPLHWEHCPDSWYHLQRLQSFSGWTHPNLTDDFVLLQLRSH